MLDSTHLSLFVIASAVLLITPGPAVLYIVGRSVDQGRRAGLVSVCGIETGNFVHVIAATIGLSALLLSSALAFNIVKYLGAAYLVYLGLRKILTPEAPSRISAASLRLGRVYTQGAIVAALNPKTALFFIAFLPQFVDPSQGAVSWQIFILGCIFIILAVLSDSLYALLAGTVGQWLRDSGRALLAGRFVVGGLYIGLGLTAALSGSRQK